MRGELEAEQNCNILTPTLMAITAFLSGSPELLKRRPGGPASLRHVPHSSIFAPTGLISNWLTSSLHLVYIIVRRSPSSCGRHKSHSFNPSTLNVPVFFYTGEFPNLIAWPGSIYYKTSIHCLYRGILYLPNEGICVLVRILCLCYDQPQKAIRSSLKFYRWMPLFVLCFTFYWILFSLKFWSWFFEHWGHWSNCSRRAAFIPARTVSTCGLWVCHDNISMAVF